MINCIVCNTQCPPIKRITRWGAIRKYCSSKCIKTAYRQKYKDRDTVSKKKWLENNPEKRKESSSAYMKRNRGYYNSYSTLRSRHMKQAQPKCLSEWDLFYIEEFYDIASKRGLEVDHIIPIKNKIVCGLHVPANLQMLSRTANAKKNNKFDEDVLCVFKETK